VRHALLGLLVLAAACGAPEARGLWPTPEGSGAQVRWDVTAKPLPELPFPNDFATRYDPSSPSKRRLDVSLVAKTDWERSTREGLDQLDGFSTYAPVTVAFDRPLDLESLISRHQGDDYAPRNDAVFVFDVSPDSPDFCQPMPLDLGEGNFPLTLEARAPYPNDPEPLAQQLLFEEREEDRNHDGKLDLGEDLDMDGVLDHPNLRFPGDGPFSTLGWYERETNTLIMKPVLPLRERTTYAAVITRRVLDETGRPVRSPFPYVNHAEQTKTLEPLNECLARQGLALEDVAFTWAFTTQNTSADFQAVRDGLYGVGPMQRLAEQFPAELTQLYPVREPGQGVNVRIIPGAAMYQAAKDLLPLLQSLASKEALDGIVESIRFVDFYAVFSFDSPQFFPREDASGATLPLYRQTWQVDPVTGAAFVRPEKVTVLLTVPKNRKGPAPVAILGHGYTSFKVDPLLLGGYFARHGIASVGMEAVGHGLPFSPVEIDAARGLVSSKGLVPFLNAVVNHRAIDLDGDKLPDSGGDFFTTFVFHTRDMVRQSTVDFMQLVRVLRSFDGRRRWKYDTSGDGAPDLAGDFDGDGQVDVGGPAPIHMTGGSLGGILSTMVGGSEPQIDLALPFSGGAGLIDLGARSVHGGVLEAITLRMLGPLLVTLPAEQGDGLELWEYVASLNKLETRKLARVPVALNESDTAVLTNLKTGEYRCARVQAGGRLRAAISSDQGDALRLQVFSGVLPPKTPEGCVVPDDAVPAWTQETLDFDARYHGVDFKAGTPLIAFDTGLGLRRQSPELRRTLELAQLGVDRGDPINFAPNFERRHLEYGTGEVVKTRSIVLNVIGDMDVPIASGASIARAAGFIELRQKDPRYGATVNRVLIDRGVLEGVERTHRYQDAKGRDVLMDVENFSQAAGKDDGFDVPRLSPPLRAVGQSPRVGGVTGAIFPLVTPTGHHGFDPPNPASKFDVGGFLVNLLGRYGSSGGETFDIEPCLADSSCAWLPPPPPVP